MMAIEIDTSEADMDTVAELIMLIGDAILSADHIDPTAAEFALAVGELLQMVIDEGLDETMH